jgi:hypothetical protein
MNLKDLTAPQLKSIKQSLDKYFYGAGTNIALLSALRKKPVVEFQHKMAQAIKAQINAVAQIEHLQTLRKESYWLSLADAFPGGRVGILAFLAMAAQEGGQAALDKMVPGHTFALENEEINKMLVDRVEFLIGSIDETGLSWVTKVLETGLKNHLPETEIIRILRAEADRIATQRSEVVTEMELMTAMNLVEAETYKRNGIEMVSWKTSADEQVCMEICEANEKIGKIALGVTFPGGQTEPPGHIRCRCFLLPVLPVALEGTVWTGK